MAEQTRASSPPPPEREASKRAIMPYTIHREPLLSAASPRLIEEFIIVPHNESDFRRFLAQVVMSSDHILHLGCQNGAIALQIAPAIKPDGRVYGVNSPGHDTKRAKEIAEENGLDDMISFLDVPDLTMLPFLDDTFDIVYASEIMAQLPPLPDHDNVVKVLSEMKRVTKPGGLVLTRDLAAQHFFPNHDLIDMVTRALFQASGLTGWYGPMMPALFSRAGLERFTVNCSTSYTQGSAVGDSDWATARVKCLAKGTPLRKKWIAAGVREAMIDLIIEKLKIWGSFRDSWYVCLYTDMVAQKESSEPTLQNGLSTTTRSSKRPDSPRPGSPHSVTTEADPQDFDTPLPDSRDQDPPSSGVSVPDASVQGPPEVEPLSPEAADPNAPSDMLEEDHSQLSPLLPNGPAPNTPDRDSPGTDDQESASDISRDA
ncbi:S-adenosyl-L-methionine-dependent methyltransferase [Xylaria cf. heliscus]|nr:S-adenosyl-L-methionine-dependent methyltransferase [Xylaria cf. heliscus]